MINIIFSFLCIIAVSQCAAYEPILKTGVKIQANGVDIDVGKYSIPETCDWNNDGRKDLIIGQFWDGKIRLYLNGGSDQNPVFATFSWLEADGEIISIGHY